MVETKKCSRCNQDKPLTDFGPDRRHKSGIKAICRPCDCEVHRLRYPADSEARKASAKAYYKKTYSHKLHKRTEEGLCWFCDRPARQGQTRCQEHWERDLSAQRKRTKDFCDRTKDAVFSHYGKQCECCGESNLIFLTIDHINNDGAEHRRQISGGKSNRGWIYPWLVQNNFPPGFRTLCYNCNIGRYRNGGICPHQEQKQEGYIGSKEEFSLHCM